MVGSIGNAVKSPMHGSHLDLVLAAQGTLGMGVGSGDRRAGSPLQTVDSEMSDWPSFFLKGRSFWCSKSDPVGLRAGSTSPADPASLSSSCHLPYSPVDPMLAQLPPPLCPVFLWDQPLFSAVSLLLFWLMSNNFTRRPLPLCPPRMSSFTMLMLLLQWVMKFLTLKCAVGMCFPR